jgi:uncharacterized protein (DUF1684 family)
MNKRYLRGVCVVNSSMKIRRKQLRDCAGMLLLSATTLVSAQTSSSADAAWRNDLLAWRQIVAGDLQKPDGWLSLVGLEWLEAGDNTFGAAADNHLRLPSSVSPHIGVLQLHGDRVTLIPPAGGFPGGLLLDGRPATAQTLTTDGTKSILSIGTLSMLVIHRGDRYALRLKDSQSPDRLHFHGLRWYPPSKQYRVTARWEPNAPAKTEKIPTILGTTIQMPAPGVAHFTWNGRQLALEPVLESAGDRELFFLVRDMTSQTTTYGAARFLYTGFPDHGLDKPGEVVLDFNKLQNPPCAYTAYATCPLPPPQNRLKVALPAGEKRYHE